MQVDALREGTAGEYFRPQQSGFGSTSIAPKALNTTAEGALVPSHVVAVDWQGTGGPSDPAFEPIMAAAARRMVENMVYAPNLHAHSGGGGGYTTNAPDVLASERDRIERARIAAAIKEATG